MKVYLFTDDFLNDDELNAIASYMAKNGGDIVDSTAYFYSQKLNEQYNSGLVKSDNLRPSNQMFRSDRDISKISNRDIIKLADYLNISDYYLNKILGL
jgi:hypothetical protein